MSDLEQVLRGLARITERLAEGADDETAPEDNAIGSEKPQGETRTDDPRPTATGRRPGTADTG